MKKSEGNGRNDGRGNMTEIKPVTDLNPAVTEGLLDRDSLVGVKGQHAAHQVLGVVTHSLPGGRVQLRGKRAS